MNDGNSLFNCAWYTDRHLRLNSNIEGAWSNIIFSNFELLQCFSKIFLMIEQNLSVSSRDISKMHNPILLFYSNKTDKKLRPKPWQNTFNTHWTDWHMFLFWFCLFFKNCTLIVRRTLIDMRYTYLVAVHTFL